MSKQKYPPGWNEERVHRVIAHYDNQTEEEQAAEIEAAIEDPTQTMMWVPTELVPKIAWLIAQHAGSASNKKGKKGATTRAVSKRVGRKTAARR